MIDYENNANDVWCLFLVTMLQTELQVTDNTIYFSHMAFNYKRIWNSTSLYIQIYVHKNVFFPHSCSWLVWTEWAITSTTVLADS